MRTLTLLLAALCGLFIACGTATDDSGPQTDIPDGHRWDGTYGAIKGGDDLRTGKMIMDADGSFHLVVVDPEGGGRSDMQGKWAVEGGMVHLHGQERSVSLRMLAPDTLLLDDAQLAARFRLVTMR